MSSGVAASTSSYESIASATGTGSSGTITFSSIPSTYASLQIRIFSQDSSINQNGIRFNSDSGSNYFTHYIVGGGTAANAGAIINTNRASYVAYSASAANTGGVAIIDILDYASTTKNKTVKSFAGWDENGSGEVYLTSGLWLNTSAINSFSIVNLGSNFTTQTQVALYGIKGA